MTNERGIAESMLDDALLDEMLSEAGFADEPPAPHVRPRGHARPVALSFGQELLWSLDRSSPGLTAYNIPIARRIVGPLDVQALEESLRAVVARHEILRTRFPVIDGQPVQVVDPPGGIDLLTVEIQSGDRAERELDAARRVTARARTPFDFAVEPPFRATLVRIDAFDHVLLLETHHIACDGWSIGIILRELSTFYCAPGAGVEPNLPAPALQYADYAAWERATISGAELEGLLAYWRAELGDGLESLDLPTDYPRGKALTFEGVGRSLALTPEFSERLKSTMRAAGMTQHMALLAAFAIVLHRYTGRLNVIVGSNVGARADSRLDDMIGYFNKTLPLRIDFSGEPTCAQLLERVRATSLGAYDHQEIPIEQLGLELQTQQPDSARAQLFDVVLTAQAAPSQLELRGLAVEPFGVDLGATKFDFTLFTSESDAGVRLMLRARSELWAPQSVDRCLGHVEQVLHGMVADPALAVGRVPLLTAGERRELGAWNATGAGSVPSSVVERVAAAMARVPTRVALCCGAEHISYGQLRERVRRLAGRLRAAGVRPGVLVGLLLERSIDAIVALLAIWNAGAAYVPLAVDGPKRRIARQLTDLGCHHVVTATVHAASIDGLENVVSIDVASAGDGEPIDGVEIVPRGDALAYVLFTSGTSGTPKAVGVTHANLANYVSAISSVLATPPDGATTGLDDLGGLSFGLVSTLAADLGNTALFPALCAGATLHVVPSDVATDAGRFAAYTRANPIDVLKITPNHFRALAAGASSDAAVPLMPRRWLIVGGERLGWEAATEIEDLRNRSGEAGCRILNHYGPTETTVGACTFELTAFSVRTARALGAQSVPIGRPVSNVTASVCDPNGELVPVGIPGELYVGGAGVAAGYLNAPELTTERFVTLAGFGRVYRTGDRVRRLPGGDLEFLGRADLQVKVRGYRIELGAIEAALATGASVAEVAVVAREEFAGTDATLVAYVVPRDGSSCTAGELQSHVAELLPPHERPSSVVFVERLPLTTNGKLDRRALSTLARASAPQRRIGPHSPTETALVAIWSESFKRDPAQFGVTDDFFELGGNSLLAIRILGKIGRTLGVRLSLRLLFETPTIERLAAAVDAERARPGTTARSESIVPVARDAYRVARGPGGVSRP